MFVSVGQYIVIHPSSLSGSVLFKKYVLCTSLCASHRVKISSLLDSWPIAATLSVYLSACLSLSSPPRKKEVTWLWNRVTYKWTATCDDGHRVSGNACDWPLARLLVIGSRPSCLQGRNVLSCSLICHSCVWSPIEPDLWWHKQRTKIVVRVNRMLVVFCQIRLGCDGGEW